MDVKTDRLEMLALDGSNPLAFLAAIGALVVLSECDPSLRLGWRRTARWMPFVQSSQKLDQASVCTILAEKLRGLAVCHSAEKQRAAAQGAMDNAKRKLKNAHAALKARKIRGKERDAARKTENIPLEEDLARVRSEYLQALKDAIPSPELAIGQRPDCTIEEFREHANGFLDNVGPANRTAVDLLGAFGAEMGVDEGDRIRSTPFCFITGSGHQWFLDTARQLMAQASPAKVCEALFSPWAYTDEKLTMRWDPTDDRRYALLDRDPTASDNKSCTVWMANLLAYRALVLFPCAPVRGRCVAPGWTSTGKSAAFTWPIWEEPLTRDMIFSLLCHSAFTEVDLAHFRHELHARGVVTLFRSSRIQVGKPPLHKINFSPAQSL